jgi:regulator of cell morphogenesis and NO signaling
MFMPTNTLLKTIALSHPAAVRVLEKYHLDYCCGGEQTLAQACQKADLPVAAVLADLYVARSAPQEEPFWDWVSPSALIRFILNTHHAFTRAELLRLESLLGKVIHAHGGKHPELKAVEACFAMLRDELKAHLLKEENILFPYIEALEKFRLADGLKPQACFATIEHPLTQMGHEHEIAGDLLKRIRQATHDFALPADACPSFQALYQGLEAFETDLMRHIHLENHVLFPQARELLQEGMAGEC